MKKKALTFLLCVSVYASAMQREQTIHKKAQLSAAHWVEIRYANANQAQKIKDDILSSYSTSIRDFGHGRMNMWLNASEAQIRERFKNMSWYSQIEAIEGDCEITGID